MKATFRNFPTKSTDDIATAHSRVRAAMDTYGAFLRNGPSEHDGSFDVTPWLGPEVYAWADVALSGLLGLVNAAAGVSYEADHRAGLKELAALAETVREHGLDAPGVAAITRAALVCSNFESIEAFNFEDWLKGCVNVEPAGDAVPAEDQPDVCSGPVPVHA